MGLLAWVRRRRRRRAHLDQSDREAAKQLAESRLAEAAPALAEAFQTLHGAVTGTAYDAVAAAYDSLAPLCTAEVTKLREQLQSLQRGHAERVSKIASDCREDTATVRELQAEQARQLADLRQIYAEQQEQVRRVQEGYDWQVVKEFCFRFIRILDSLDTRIEALDQASGSDLRDTYCEIQFALEASGVEQFVPELRQPFAGREKELKVVGKQTSATPEDQGLVARVRQPGYRLVREGSADRVLRPAHVEIYGTPQHSDSAPLQETTP